MVPIIFNVLDVNKKLFLGSLGRELVGRRPCFNPYKVGCKVNKKPMPKRTSV
jgi:hypothetical protein